MHLGLQTVVHVVVGRLLDDSAAVRVAIGRRPLDEVLSERSLLMLILHLGRIVVRYLDRLVLG